MLIIIELFSGLSLESGSCQKKFQGNLKNAPPHSPHFGPGGHVSGRGGGVENFEAPWDRNLNPPPSFVRPQRWRGGGVYKIWHRINFCRLFSGSGKGPPCPPQEEGLLGGRGSYRNKKDTPTPPLRQPFSKTNLWKLAEYQQLSLRKIRGTKNTIHCVRKGRGNSAESLRKFRKFAEICGNFYDPFPNDPMSELMRVRETETKNQPWLWFWPSGA